MRDKEQYNRRLLHIAGSCTRPYTWTNGIDIYFSNLICCMQNVYYANILEIVSEAIILSE